MPKSLRKSLSALLASVPSVLARMTRRVVRSTRVLTADPLRAPLIRSPSQWPSTVRVATSAGRSVIGVMLGIWPRRSVPRARGRRALRSAASSSLSRVPQSSTYRPRSMVSAESCFRMSSGYSCRRCPAICSGEPPSPDVSGHTATFMDPGMCAVAVADGPEPTPGCAPCKPDRVPPSRCGPAHGSRCWALASTPSPSSVENGRGPATGLRFHVLRHSCVDRISFAWQHRSPSGREVLHLDLELKPYSQADATDTMVCQQARQ
jgi:hypothetical protein